MISKFGDKLKQLRTERNMSQDELAALLDTSKQVISRYETNQRTPKITTAQEYADKLKVPLNFLIDNDVQELPSNCAPLSSLPMIPVVGKIAAGKPILARENIIGYIPTDIKNSNEYFYLHVEGDSMINAGIENGSDVLIRSQNCAENGQIVACFVNGDSATLKRFKQIGDTVVLMPENSNYEPIIVKCNDFESGYARILGVAVEVNIRKKL
jgi:SOS-response transcriptional repressors (RecA-mediated autopeptidases)